MVAFCREMKESIAELLQEIDQSRGGDTTWDQNKSFGLHKLQRIVEEEGTRYITLAYFL